MRIKCYHFLLHSLRRGRFALREKRGGRRGEEEARHVTMYCPGGEVGVVLGGRFLLHTVQRRLDGSFYNVLSRQGGWRGCTWKKISVLYCTEAIGRVEGPFDNVLSRREG